MSNNFDNIIDMLEESPAFLKKGEFTKKQADFYRGLCEEYSKSGFSKYESERREYIQRSVEGWLESLGIYTPKLFDRLDVELMERYTQREAGE